MLLHTSCGTRPKQYPLNSKLPCFSTSPEPQNCVSFKLQGHVPQVLYAEHRVPIYWLLCSIRGLLKASSSELPPKKPRNVLSSRYSRPGAYHLQRSNCNTAVSLCRTSSNFCYGWAPGSSPPCGQSQDSGNIDLLPSFGVPCRRSTRF